MIKQDKEILNSLLEAISKTAINVDKSQNFIEANCMAENIFVLKKPKLKNKSININALSYCLKSKKINVNQLRAIYKQGKVKKTSNSPILKEIGDDILLFKDEKIIKIILSNIHQNENDAIVDSKNCDVGLYKKNIANVLIRNY